MSSDIILMSSPAECYNILFLPLACRDAQMSMKVGGCVEDLCGSVEWGRGSCWCRGEMGGVRSGWGGCMGVSLAVSMGYWRTQACHTAQGCSMRHERCLCVGSYPFFGITHNTWDKPLQVMERDPIQKPHINLPLKILLLTGQLWC